MHALRRLRLAFGLAILAELCVAGVASRAAALASLTSGHPVKATFVFNFIRFTTWPAEVLPAGASLEVCVFGESPIAMSLEGFSGHVVDGHALVVRRVVDPSDLQVCHLVFVSEVESRRAAVALDAIRQRPVLTVGEQEDFLQHGGMINFVADDDRLRFDISQAAAERVNVKISAHLLQLARRTGDGRRP